MKLGRLKSNDNNGIDSGEGDENKQPKSINYTNLREIISDRFTAMQVVTTLSKGIGKSKSKYSGKITTLVTGLHGDGDAGGAKEGIRGHVSQSFLAPSHNPMRYHPIFRVWLWIGKYMIVHKLSLLPPSNQQSYELSPE